MAVHHPHLALGYVRSRLRLRQVLEEQRRGDGWSARPLGITLKPVLSCNLRCAMCSFVANKAVDSSPHDSLPLDVWTRLVDEVAHWRPYLWLTGGEPTLYPAVLPLIRHVKSRGLLCGMTTNGVTLEALAEAIVQARLDILVVSLDGPGDVHDRVRGKPGAFDRARRGIEALRRAQDNDRRRRPVVVINCSLSSGNYNRAHEMVALADDLGVAALHVQHLWMLTEEMVAAHNVRWGAEHYVSPDMWAMSRDHGMDPECVAETVQRLARTRTSVPILYQPDLARAEIELYYAAPSTFVRRRPAVCAWVNTDVLPNGDVSPCYDVVCGNIRRDSFTDIWNNAAFRRHRQRLSKEGDFPICARCCAYWRRE